MKLFFLIFTTILSLADEGPENFIKFHPRFENSKFSVLSTPTLIIDLVIHSDYKAYSDMLDVEWVSPLGFEHTKFQVTPSQKTQDKFSKKIREFTYGNAKLTTVLKVPQNLSPGSYDAKFKIKYQICTHTKCHFPKTLEVNLPFEIIEVNELKENKITQKNKWLDYDYAKQNGDFYLILFVFIAGILTSFTPCVLPMIPITLAVIGAKAHNVKRKKRFLLSLFYVLGIAFMFSILGIVAAKSGSLFGSFLGSAPVAIALGVLFCIFGLSLYGLFEIRTPHFITQKLSRIDSKGGFFGAFVTGLIGGVIASPCVGPVLVSILTIVANSQDTFKGFYLLFIYAMGMGQIFLLLGIFSEFFDKVPKSGNWQDALKFLFGTTMFAGAFYYLKPILPIMYFEILVGIYLVAIASIYGAFDKNLTSNYKKLSKGFFILVFLLGLLLVLRNFLPHYSTLQFQVLEEKKLPWIHFSDSELENAKNLGKPVIIDFWAEWCAACLELDKITFVDERILARKDDFVWLKVDATQESELLDKLKKRYKVLGLPTVIFISQNGEVITDLTLTGFENAELFLNRIYKIK